MILFLVEPLGLQEAMEFAARHLRPEDAVCIGIYPKEHPDGLEEDIRLLEEELAG